MRYVIIGGSIAGISAAKAIRENSPGAEITMISGENAKPYYRPLIPFVVAGQKSEQDIAYDVDPLQGKSITTILGTVTGVDTGKKEVLLASGDRLSFDALLIASGGLPLKPQVPGLEGEGAFPLRSLANAIRIRDAAVSARSAVVIGGGLVGIKAATALRSRAVGRGKTPMDVTIIEMLPHLLSQRLDKHGAGIVRAAVAREGITVLTGATVSGIARRKSAVSAVRLASGKTLKADIVIVASGVRPNIGFLRNSGIRTNKGILVDEHLQTNITGVYAAGDVVEGRELLTGETAVSGLWTNALEMGRIAGMNMAGGNVKYPGFLSVMNATEISGVPFVSAGVIEPKGSGYEVVTHDGPEGYWKLVLQGDFLVGAVFVGDISRAGIYVNLIKSRIPVRKAKDRIVRRTAGYADLMI